MPKPESAPSISSQVPELDLDSYHHLATPIPYKGRVIDSRDTLEDYIANTDHIVGILDGTVAPDEEILKLDKEMFDATGKVSYNTHKASEFEGLPKPDVVLWLDKSARPVSWMVKELWDQLATPDKSGQLPQRPKSVFLNIDREPWLMMSGVSAKEIDATRSDQFKINNLGDDTITPKQIIGNIRGLFVETKRVEIDESGVENTVVLTEENFDKEVWKMPLKSKPDGTPYEHMVIVDEVRSSGATSKIARELLTTALPELFVTTAHWQSQKTARSDEQGPGWVPVWYNAKDDTGRGIGNLNSQWYLKSDKNLVQKKAVGVLSAPLIDGATGERIKDRRAKEIRADIKQLAKDLGRHALLYKPLGRPRDQIRTRIESVNNMSLDEYRSRRGTTLLRKP